MTIAACYLSPEGVVFGADSATTFGSRQHFFYGQKIFEVGKKDEAPLGITMWGLGSLGDTSYRTLIAQLSDQVIQDPSRPVKDVAEAWASLFWDSYRNQLQQQIARIKELKAKDDRTDEEDEELDDLISRHSGGFCLGDTHALTELPRHTRSLTPRIKTAPTPCKRSWLASPSSGDNQACFNAWVWASISAPTSGS